MAEKRSHSGKGRGTIPREIRRKVNLKRGDLVVFQGTNAGVVIKPASDVLGDDLRKETSALFIPWVNNSRITQQTKLKPR